MFGNKSMINPLTPPPSEVTYKNAFQRLINTKSDSTGKGKGSVIRLFNLISHFHGRQQLHELTVRDLKREKIYSSVLMPFATALADPTLRKENNDNYAAGTVLGYFDKVHQELIKIRRMSTSLLM